MLSSIFAKTLRDARAGMLWWGLGIGALGLFVGLLYPTVLESASALTSYLDTFPDWLMGLFGGNRDFLSLSGWANLEFLSYLPILLSAATIAAGSGAFAGEEDKRTLDLLMSQPIPRWRVAVEKFAAIALATLVVTIVTALMFAAGLVSANVEFDLGDVLLATLNGMPLALAMGALALLGSALLPTRGAAAAVPAAILAASFFLNSFAPFIEGIKDAQKLSLYYYYTSSQPLAGSMEWGHVAFLLGLALAFWLASIWAFERRELRIG